MQPAFKDYLGNRWIQVRRVMVVVGWGPLLGILLLAGLGLWLDPNPIGPPVCLYGLASNRLPHCLGI